DDVLAQFFQFGDERGKIAVTGDDNEGVNVILRVGEVHGIDAQPNVGGVLADLSAAWDFDEFDGRFMKRSGVGAEPAPVGIGFLGDNLTLFDQAFKNALDIKPVAPTLEAQGQVFEIHKYGQRTVAVRHGVPFQRGRRKQLPKVYRVKGLAKGGILDF